MEDVPRNLKFFGAIAAASIISALLITAVTPARPKQPTIAAGLQDAPAVKGVRTIPIYHKVQDRMPLDSTPIGDTFVEKSPPLWLRSLHKAPPVIAQKTDDQPPPKVATASPPEVASEPEPEPEPEPEVHRHSHASEHHREHHAEVDVCALHHMHKVYTHEGKSWRCRK